MEKIMYREYCPIHCGRGLLGVEVTTPLQHRFIMMLGEADENKRSLYGNYLKTDPEFASILASEIVIPYGRLLKDEKSIIETAIPTLSRIREERIRRNGSFPLELNPIEQTLLSVLEELGHNTEDVNDKIEVYRQKQNSVSV